MSKNLAKLVQKTVIGKDGKKRTVWVRPGGKKENPATRTGSADEENAKELFTRAKRAWMEADADGNKEAKKKAAAALDKYHEQLVNHGVHKKGGNAFWKQ